jgi:hypothetical protein
MVRQLTGICDLPTSTGLNAFFMGSPPCVHAIRLKSGHAHPDVLVRTDRPTTNEDIRALARRACDEVYDQPDGKETASLHFRDSYSHF